MQRGNKSSTRSNIKLSDPYFSLPVIALTNIKEPTTVDNILTFIRINFPRIKTVLRENWENAVRGQLSTHDSVFLKKTTPAQGRGRPKLLYYLNTENDFYQPWLQFWRNNDPTVLGIGNQEIWPAIIEGQQGFQQPTTNVRRAPEIPPDLPPVLKSTGNKLIDQIAASLHRAKTVNQNVVAPTATTRRPVTTTGNEFTHRAPSVSTARANMVNQNVRGPNFVVNTLKPPVAKIMKVPNQQMTGSQMKAAVGNRPQTSTTSMQNPRRQTTGTVMKVPAQGSRQQTSNMIMKNPNQQGTGAQMKPAIPGNQPQASSMTGNNTIQVMIASVVNGSKVFKKVNLPYFSSKQLGTETLPKTPAQPNTPTVPNQHPASLRGAQSYFRPPAERNFKVVGSSTVVRPVIPKPVNSSPTVHPSQIVCGTTVRSSPFFSATPKQIVAKFSPTIHPSQIVAAPSVPNVPTTINKQRNFLPFDNNERPLVEPMEVDPPADESLINDDMPVLDDQSQDDDQIQFGLATPPSEQGWTTPESTAESQNSNEQQALERLPRESETETQHISTLNKDQAQQVEDETVVNEDLPVLEVSTQRDEPERTDEPIPSPEPATVSTETQTEPQQQGLERIPKMEGETVKNAPTRVDATSSMQKPRYFGSRSTECGVDTGNPVPATRGTKRKLNSAPHSDETAKSTQTEANFFKNPRSLKDCLDNAKKMLKESREFHEEAESIEEMQRIGALSAKLVLFIEKMEVKVAAVEQKKKKIIKQIKYCKKKMAVAQVALPVKRELGEDGNLVTVKREQMDEADEDGNPPKRFAGIKEEMPDN